MIEATIGHWDALFAEEFDGWYTAPRILIRRLQIYAHKSRFDGIVADGDTLEPEEMKEIVNSAIGQACALILSRDLDEIDLGFGIEYIEVFASSAGVRYSSPLYPYAIGGLLCEAGLYRQLTTAGMDFLTAEEEEKDAELKILRRPNKLNSMISELLRDRKLHKSIKRIDPSRDGLHRLVFRGLVGLIAVGFGVAVAMIHEAENDASYNQFTVAEVWKEEQSVPHNERANPVTTPRGTTISDAVAEAVALPDALTGLREWESSDGRKMRAVLLDVVRGADGKLVGKFLRADGQEFDLPLGKLSPEGIADVKAAMVAAGLWHEGE